MSSDRERITTKEAAKILGHSDAWVRAKMKQGVLKIGNPLRTGKKGSTREFTYLIYRDLVEKERTGWTV